ncbi:MAG: hypothetical protein JJ913_03965 [Rhizobiaceae bacterium]|nr:hypothetical protein [Rhizobiaceae bacterium]
MKQFKQFVLLFAVMAVAACQAPQSVQDFSNRQMGRYAIGKSYAQVASTPDFEEDSLGRVKLYGQPIGSYPLASGDVVHRHIKRYAAGSKTTDFGFIRQSESVRYQYRLAYFRVGPNGVVNDMAVGTVPGETTKCVGRFYGLVETCEDGETPAQSLAIYDQVVRTLDGQPISAWGPAAIQAPAPATSG